jgi:6-phosphofructokinase 1
VEGLIGGQKNVMAGIVNNDLVYTPFEDTIRLPKPISEDLLRMVKILSV